MIGVDIAWEGNVAGTRADRVPRKTACSKATSLLGKIYGDYEFSRDWSIENSCEEAGDLNRVSKACRQADALVEF